MLTAIHCHKSLPLLLLLKKSKYTYDILPGQLKKWVMNMSWRTHHWQSVNVWISWERKKYWIHPSLLTMTKSDATFQPMAPYLSFAEHCGNNRLQHNCTARAITLKNCHCRLLQSCRHCGINRTNLWQHLRRWMMLWGCFWLHPGKPSGIHSMMLSPRFTLTAYFVYEI